MICKPYDAAYITLQDPPTRDYEQSWVKLTDLPLENVSSVLDIGCKAGKLVKELTDAGYAATGIDIGPGCKAYWNKHYPTLDLRCADFLTMPLPPAKYDLIVLSHVLEHLYNPVEALARLRALLVPGGKVYLTFPINQSYGAHYFTLESEKEIREFFSAWTILQLTQTTTAPYPIYELIIS